LERIGRINTLRTGPLWRGALAFMAAAS